MWIIVAVSVISCLLIAVGFALGLPD